MAFDDVAIIGAGISGLTLALLLKKDGFNVKIYEMKSANVTTEGAIALSPNGLKIIHSLGLGLLERIYNQGFSFQSLTFRNKEHDYLDRYECGGEEKFGYNSYRIYRETFLDDLKSLVDQADIPVIYNRKFSHVVTESRETNIVVFSLSDGSQVKTNLIIGADGIHSRVRRYLLPGIEPTWSGAVAVSCASPTAAVNFPDEKYKMHLPVNIHGPTGAVHIAPQNPEGTEVLVAVQWMTPERSREGWEELNNHKTKLREIMTEIGYLNDITKTAIVAAPDRSFSIWPFYTVPRLDKWYSRDAKVAILGDAAHAVPPTGGQGANQALEDVYSLSLLMAAVRDGKADWDASVKWWQDMRQERIDKVIQISTEIRKRRMPGWTGESADTIDSTWLFGADLNGKVSKWLDEQEER